jgi:hypothetical protein
MGFGERNLTPRSPSAQISSFLAKVQYSVCSLETDWGKTKNRVIPVSFHLPYPAISIQRSPTTS